MLANCFTLNHIQNNIYQVDMCLGSYYTSSYAHIKQGTLVEVLPRDVKLYKFKHYKWERNCFMNWCHGSAIRKVVKEFKIN